MLSCGTGSEVVDKTTNTSAMFNFSCLPCFNSKNKLSLVDNFSSCLPWGIMKKNSFCECCSSIKPVIIPLTPLSNTSINTTAFTVFLYWYVSFFISMCLFSFTPILLYFQIIALFSFTILIVSVYYSIFPTLRFPTV